MWPFSKKKEAQVEEIKRQVMQEAKELKDAPKIAIASGLMERCHICGQVFSRDQLRTYDSHISTRLVRRACPTCHPERGNL